MNETMEWTTVAGLSDFLCKWPLHHAGTRSGNTQDGSTVPAVLDRLKDRFRIRWLIFVGDRGMVSRENLATLDRLDTRLSRSGVKGVVTRSGFRRFLRVDGEEVTIDREKVERDP